MAEAHKFSTLDKALAVFPELSWAQDADGNVYVDNSKTGERVPVSEGQHIVKIADRYEVHDDAPANAHEAEVPKATKAEAEGEKSAPLDPPNPQVEPNAIGAPAGSEAAEPADPASVDAADAPAAPAAE